MLRAISILVPLLIRRGTPNPVKVMTGYAGAFVLAIIAFVFAIAAVFTWVTTTYGLDLAFLSVAIILAVAAAGLLVASRVSQAKAQKQRNENVARIKGLIAAQNDPLADHIPEDLLSHPMSQKILAQVEDRPLAAGAAAVGVGVLLSHQLLDAFD